MFHTWNVETNPFIAQKFNSATSLQGLAVNCERNRRMPAPAVTERPVSELENIPERW